MDSDVHKVQDKGDGGKAGALMLNKVSSKNDQFSRVHEDPLLLMKQNEMKARNDGRLKSNSSSMSKVREELATRYGVVMAPEAEKSKTHIDSRDKKERKERKEKKSKKGEKDRKEKKERRGDEDSST